MAAKRSSVVLGRVGVGVTMFSPLVDGTGDDSAVLESNTSPETDKQDIQVTYRLQKKNQNPQMHT